MARRVRENSSALSTMIAQHQTEASSRPTITSFTTICAPKNMPQMEISAAAPESGAAISAGFMKVVLGSRGVGGETVAAAAESSAPSARGPGGVKKNQVALAPAAPSRRLRSQSGMARESAEILSWMRRTIRKYERKA